jgi:hypothetical protein
VRFEQIISVADICPQGEHQQLKKIAAAFVMRLRQSYT